MSLLSGLERMTDTPQVLLVHHLKRLKLPTLLREYDNDRPAVRLGRRRSRPLPVETSPSSS